MAFKKVESQSNPSKGGEDDDHEEQAGCSVFCSPPAGTRSRDVSYMTEIIMVGITPPEDETLPAGMVTVLYCDRCRRWGRPGTTHLCGATWDESLGDLLAAFVAEKGLTGPEIATETGRRAR
jgi:hypothetical protein